MTPPDDPALSVVVMGYLNETTICDSVASVWRQECEGELEVLVVTSGRDGSAELVRQRFTDVTVIESSDRLLPGAARNVGVRAARGNFIAFLAADCLAAPGWASARLAAHRAGYDAVAAGLLPREPASAAAWAGHYLLFPSRLPGGRSEEIGYPDDRTHGLSYARELLDRLGPFREDLRIGEDTEMARRVRNHGVPVWLAADAVIEHPGPQRIRELVRDLYLRGRRSARFAGAPPPRRWTRTRALLGAFLRGLPRHFWRAARPASSQAPVHRLRVIRVAPYMLLGTAAHQAGWAGGRLATIDAVERGTRRPGSSGLDERSPALPGSGRYVRSLFDLPEQNGASRVAAVALTFDDGPDPSSTPLLLDILERFDARATFFMVGEAAARHPDLVREVAHRGHAVQSHTWSHVDLTELHPDHLEREIDETNALLTSFSGRRVRAVRPPYARHSPEIVEALYDRGLATVLWSVDSKDWERPGPEAIARNATELLGAGELILLHDGGGDRSQTIAALPEILARVRERGYACLPLYR